MKRNNIRGFIALTGISALTNAASATQPPCATSDGRENTACGSLALFDNTGLSNTAMGQGALQHNLSTSYNTAVGAFALVYSYGLNNTAIGYDALQGVSSASTSTGSFNTAIGSGALQSFTTSNNNSAGGYYALQANTSGSYNTAFGAGALRNNQAVNGNSAFGYYALKSNTIGAYNVALGSGALQGNSRGNQNVASGNSALLNNFSGNNNTASGYEALFNNTTGSDNIALGYQAGLNVKTGNNTIEIGNKGTASDSKVIKIGIENLQSNTYIAGIYNVTSLTGGLAVFVDSTGHLGTASSSARFKTDIVPMGSNTEKLRQLRPVTFHYRADTQGTMRYGLIAEEVAKVYPELVVQDQNGRIDGVRYDELMPILLNEVQKQQKIVATQALKIAVEDQRAAAQDATIASLKQQLAGILAALVELQPMDQLVARH